MTASKDMVNSGGSGPMNSDHARVIAPPPVAYVPPLVTGLLLHFLWEPLRFFPEWWIGHAVGWPMVVASVLIVAWSVRTMYRAGEDPNAYKPTGAIVATGPYALSRNPIYVSFNLFYIGIALIVNTVWPAVFLPVAITFMHYGIIVREEGYLERLFGNEYRQYRARVRRWV